MPLLVKIVELEAAINAFKLAHPTNSPERESGMIMLATLYGLQIYNRASLFDLNQQPAVVQSLLWAWLSPVLTKPCPS